MARGSLSTSFMTRNQDISFGTGSPAICDAQSPEVTYRSSFSSLLMDPSTPCFTSVGFSFRSSGGSNTLEFSTPVAAMPSFAFFSPGSEAEQGNYASDFSANITRVDSIRQEASGGSCLTVPVSSLCFGHEAREMEHKAAEVRRAEGTNGLECRAS
ncbi:hypothetical protein CsSME_00029101 [Camellia sinensis var. sinensis]